MNVDALVHHLDATSRRVFERLGGPVKVIEASRVYAASPDEVWTALTDPARIARWFLPVSGDLTQGGRFQLEGHAGGEIVRCEPRAQLSLTWESGDDLSWVEVTLSADAGGTRLALEHAARPSDHWDTFGAGAAGVGWDLGLFGLDRLLADEPIAAEAFQAWSITDEGKTCTRQSA